MSARVLVACEFSGVVRDAFARRGFDAISCDLLPCERPWGAHHQGDVREILSDGFDLMIAHPPCTYLAVSGARYFAQRRELQEDAIGFVRELLAAPIPRIALENPIGVLSTRVRKPDQIVHPWMFGCGEVKATCLWLKGLPPLRPSVPSTGRRDRVHRNVAPGADRWKSRSRTSLGFANAMADQWGAVLAGEDARCTPL